MNRIWKRFLIKVGKGIAAISYFLGSMLLGGFVTDWLGYGFEPGFTAGLIVMVIFPIIAVMLHDIYQDAVREVEWENKEMMRSLKGDKYDF